MTQNTKPHQSTITQT